VSTSVHLDPGSTRRTTRLYFNGSSRVALTCIFSSIVCACALCYLLRVDRLDLHVPFSYWGDALYFDSWVKGLMSGNWPWQNPQLGMPFGADWRDFPVTLTIEAILVRVFAVFTSSPGLVLNLIWLLGTTACAGIAAYCLQRLGIHKWVAGSLSILYALQPFTFYRGVAHFNLLFYLVPLLATGAIEIAAGRIPVSQSDKGATVSPLPARLIGAFRSIPAYLYLACFAQGISYIYNSFFACILFAVAALLAYAVSHRKSGLFAGALAIFVVGCAAATSLAPSLAYWANHGNNPAMAYKSPVQAEIYGLKLRHLFTPIPGNPFPPLHYIQTKLDNAGFTGDYENATSRLGTIGSVGLLFLFAWTLVSCLEKRSGDDHSFTILGACATLALTCLLLATVGGFGALFNVFVSPDIRCYNRVVVFIDFFALTAVGLLLTGAAAWWLRRNWPKAAFAAVLTVLVAFGVLDQAVTAAYRDAAPRETQFRLDAAFVRSVESILPRNASVFQLPDTNFPLDPGAFHMLPYDQSRAYLHSDSLRWSWGGLTGREPGNWTHQIASLPVKDMLASLSAAGFSAIWIDRFGYAPGASPERQIAAALNTQVVERSDARIAFYDLRGYPQLTASKQSGDIQLTKEYALHPVEITYPSGFYAEERNDRVTWRWSLQNAVIQLHNNLPQTRTVKLQMILQTGRKQPDAMLISAAGQSQKIDANIDGVPYVRTIRLSPGQTIDVSFHCECNPIQIPSGELRRIYFGIINPNLVE
jgi:hypothetical protein